MVKRLINKMDFEALEVKMKKCKVCCSFGRIVVYDDTHELVLTDYRTLVYAFVWDNLLALFQALPLPTNQKLDGGKAWERG